MIMIANINLNCKRRGDSLGGALHLLPDVGGRLTRVDDGKTLRAVGLAGGITASHTLEEGHVLTLEELALADHHTPSANVGEFDAVGAGDRLQAVNGDGADQVTLVVVDDHASSVLAAAIAFSSGVGRVGGSSVLEAFTEPKTVVVTLD